MKHAGILRCVSFACAVLALAACGKKGDPEPLQPDQFPHQYPKAETIPETGGYGALPAPPPPQAPVLNPLTPRAP
jgi:predicted small lipoprotein YifL